MLDLSASPEAEELVARAEEAMAELVLPLEPAARRSFEGALPAIDAARREARARGLFAPHMPRELGGLGLPLLARARLGEVFGRSPLGHYVFGCAAPDLGNAELLLHHGSDAIGARYLAPLVRGELRSCLALAEPERPFADPAHLETRAERDGDEYAITGHKWLVTAAHGASFAIVLAVTNDDAPPSARASAFLVPADAKGYVHVRRVPVAGDRGFGWASASELRFDRCRVPADHRLGAEGDGLLLLRERLAEGRVHHCLRRLGLAERAFDLLCERALDPGLSLPRAFGSRRHLRALVAESRAELDAARLYVRAAAEALDREGALAAERDLRAASFHVAGVLSRVLARAREAHGAPGAHPDGLLAWLSRFERLTRLEDAPDDAHKHDVGERVLTERSRARERAEA